MSLAYYLQQIQVHLIQTHGQTLSWFEETTTIKNYRPKDNGWTVLEILEHIALTSHFLMILIDKSAKKALQNSNNLPLEELKEAFDYDLSTIDQIGIHHSFEWIRPTHMEPKGDKSELQIKAELITHLTRCLTHLDTLKNGEGLLHTTTMSVNELGRLNVYEYIYFLSKHAERHLAQMQENKSECTAHPSLTSL